MQKQDNINVTNEKALSTDSFEFGLEKINQILVELQNPSIELDNALKFYKMGLLYISDLETILNNAKLEFETIEANLNQAKPIEQDI